MKPKINRAGDIAKPSAYDRCQTPAYAVDPLVPWLPTHRTIWEPATGEGNIAATLRKSGRKVVESDILTGHNFFDISRPPCGTYFETIVTNPPYSIKYDWLERCYDIGFPFALLLPLETLGAGRAQRLFRVHHTQLIVFDRRVNFKMPGARDWKSSSAQFPTAWFCWRLNLPREINFVVRGNQVLPTDELEDSGVLRLDAP